MSGSDGDPSLLRVLVVEDSDDDALLEVHELRRCGYQIHHERVYTPERMRQAIEENFPWNVVLCDYEMPRFAASEALEILREADLDVPFIVVSGKVGEEAAVEIMKAGAYDFVSKGNLARLCPVVERGLEEARERQERKRAEENLRASEAELRALFEAMTDPIFVYDSEGRYLKVANLTLQYLTEEDLLGKTLYDVLPRRQADGLFESIQRSLATRRATRYEYELEVGSEKRWYEATVSPMLEDSVVVVARHITERKRAEENLRASEAELRALFEAMTDVVFVYDSEGRYRKVAPSNPSLLYRPQEDLLGKTVHEVLPEAQADALLAGIGESLAEQRTVNCEYDLHIGGRQLWFEATISPMMSDLVVAVARDVTERKRAEEELKESERFNRTVIEQVTENICLVDAETKRIVSANPAFQETLGYSQEELLHLTLYDIVFHDKESIDLNVESVLESGRGKVGQRKYRRKDGSLVDVEASGSVVVRNGRKTVCVVAHDVTERARIQRLLEERVTALSHVASNVTLELPMREMLDALSEAVVKASSAVACIVSLSDERTAALHPVGSFGVPDGSLAGLDASWRLAGGQSPTIRAFKEQESILVHDVRKYLLSRQTYSPIHELVEQVPWDTVYIVPLVARGQALGTITFLFLPEENLEEDERLFLRAVADQTALAVENARLLAQAHGKATLEERQRLARELHDSVSQALYGIALGVKTAQAMLKQDPQLVFDPLDYVLSLAEAGTAEMRALLFELRPESLEKEGLVAALEKQAAALEARHGIGVETVLCDEPEVPLEVKETLHRIAQEALHNTVKHAKAETVEIRMDCGEEWISLEISDNGVGFDAEGDFPGHLGLNSMRERASRLGGELRITSTPGDGARIRARIPRAGVTWTLPPSG
jgi:PAS domain S-box-containing protein